MSPKYWLIAVITSIVIIAIYIIIGLTNYSAASNPVIRFFFMVCIPLLAIKVPDWFLHEKETIISYKCRKCKHVFGTNKKRK